METNRKFKVGDKVVPLYKSHGCPMEYSVEWKSAKKINQPYLYVSDDNPFTIKEVVKSRVLMCKCVLSGNMGGDYFLESDLIPYDNAFSYGELVEVQTLDGGTWVKRIFLTKIECVPPLYMCVQGDINEENYNDFKKGSRGFKVHLWSEMRKIQEPPVEIQLNKELSAQINQTDVTVGCQKFDFNTIEKVYNEIQKMKKR